MRSTSPAGVTQTGQPGPESSVTWGGSRRFNPARAIAMVCVPQTSISRVSGTSIPVRAAARRSVPSGRRKADSLGIGHLPDGGEVLQRLLGA